MRLLNVYTMEFAEFYSDNIPPYKISSHRWVSDEATYKDVLKKRNIDSRGYKKIEGFCKFVRDDNKRLKEHESTDIADCEWMWIDTCCIDKRSSSEVSESINSMFQWYSEGLECIAYLADVPSFAAGKDTVELEFKDSEWFTRGWTLQELLAPKVVIFVNDAWEVIGHKCSYCKTSNPCKGAGNFLNEVIGKITGIPDEVLFDYEKSTDMTVDQKWSWMKDRSTTRTEDMAYCLMGIFDVQMPLLYGERLKAMARLDEEIQKKQISTSSQPTLTSQTTMNDHLSSPREAKKRLLETEEKTAKRLRHMAETSKRPFTSANPDQRFTCIYEDCAKSGVNFSTKRALVRHMAYKHNSQAVELYDCEHPGCHLQGEFGFTRYDNMKRHMVSWHRINRAIQPRDPGPKE